MASAGGKAGGPVSLKACLRAARDAIAAKEYREALRHAREALKQDKNSYEALVFLGKAAFLSGEPAQADQAYRRAADINSKALPAWQGLAEVHAAGETAADKQKLAEACERAAEASKAAGQAEKALDYNRRCVAAYTALSKVDDARRIWQAIISDSATSDLTALEARCALVDLEVAALEAAVADETRRRVSVRKKAIKAAEKSGDLHEQVDPEEDQRQVADEWAEKHTGSLEDALEGVVSTTLPLGNHARYHALRLQRAIAKLRYRAASSRSTSALLNAAISCCVEGIQQGAEGPEWLEAAMVFAEEDGSNKLPAWQALKGRVLTSDWQERYAYLGRRLLHAYPSRGLGWLGLAASLEKLWGGKAPERVQSLCERGLSLHPDSPTGWLLLAKARLAQGQAVSAGEAVQQGLEASKRLRGSMGVALRRAELALRVEYGHCLIQQDKHAEAATAFAVIRQATALGLQPEDATALQAAALAGTAKVELAAGPARFSQAAAALQAVLSFQSESSWAHSELGWLRYQQARLVADLTAARSHLETAISLELGQALHHLRLGKVLWAQGGESRRDSSASFLEAARLDPTCGAAFGALGRHYALLGGDHARAKRCLQRAVMLDPTDAAAGELLADLMASAGQASLEAALCREASASSPRAFWAWRRQGLLELRAQQWSAAAVSLQHGLRGEVGNIDAWEGLGYAYQRLGRFTAALKAYNRVQQLCLGQNQQRPFALLQAANIQLNMGDATEAAKGFRTALVLLPGNVAALCGLAAGLLARAQRWLHEGSPAAAAALLLEAGEHAMEAAKQQGLLLAPWKLLGDIHFLLSSTAPAGEQQASLGDMRKRRWEWAVTAQRAYSRAAHLQPSAAGAWADLAAALSHQADLAQPADPAKLARHWGWQLPQADTDLLQATRLKAAALRTVLGALRLEASEPALWNILGALANDVRLQQHAYVRALQIDPKNATAWVNLGQVYVREGEFDLAALAFDQARSADPGLAVPWVAMAFMRTSTSLEAPFLKEALQECLQGLQLQPIAEAQLGVGVLAARLGRLSDPQVYVALRQCVAQLPAVAAAHNLLGLACSAIHLSGDAVRSFRTAMALLPPGDRGAQQAVAVNLSRALAKAGKGEETIQHCRKAITQGHGDFKDGFTAVQAAGVACFWRAFAVAAVAKGQPDVAMSALHTVLQEVVPPTSDQPSTQHSAALRLQWQLLYSTVGPKQALQSAQESPVECWHDPRLGLVGLVLAILSKDNAAIAQVMALCPGLFTHDHAAISHRVLSYAHRLQGNDGAASRHLKTALHTFPADATLRASLGAALLHSDPCLAPVALRVAGLKAIPVHYLDVAARCFLSVGVHTLPWGLKPQKVLAGLQRWVHLHPNCPLARAALAYTAAVVARSEEHPCHRCLSAARLCSTAVALLPARAHHAERAQLEAVRSDMLLHVQGPEGGPEEAGIVANIALQQHARTANSGQGVAYHKLARCQLAAGETALADLDYERGASWGDVACAVELALLRMRGPFPATQALDVALSLAVAVRPASCGAAWQAVIHSLRAVSHVAREDWGAAAASAADAMGLCPANHALHLLHGALLMQHATNGGGLEATGAARRSLQRAAHLSRSEAVPCIHYMLAHAEAAAAGGSKKGREKWEGHILQEVLSWPPERLPAELVFQISTIADESEKTGFSAIVERSMVAKKCAKKWALHALHMNPSCRKYHGGLCKSDRCQTVA